MAINKPCPDVYAFLVDPANIYLWAKGALQAPLQQGSDMVWRTVYDGNEVILTFTPRNDFGILDMTISGRGSEDQTFRIRVFPNGAGTELCFTILQRPDASDAQFNSDCEWLRSDLMVLKSFIEGL